MHMTLRTDPYCLYVFSFIDSVPLPGLFDRDGKVAGSEESLRDIPMDLKIPSRRHLEEMRLSRRAWSPGKNQSRSLVPGRIDPAADLVGDKVLRLFH